MTKRRQVPAAERPAAPSESDVDREIAEDFQERQRLNEEGSEALAETLREHNSLSPEISAGDVDAAWELGRASGEETFTGHAPTPDQDRVDDLGAAAGLTYKDDEPLQYGKVARRDERRWELDPRSAAAEQAAEDTEDTDADDEEDDDADADDAPLRFWDLADDLDAEVDDDDDEDDEEDDDDDDDEDDDVGADEDLTLLAEDEDLVVAEDDDSEAEADDDEDLDDEDLDDEDFDDDLESLEDLEEEDDDDAD